MTIGPSILPLTGQSAMSFSSINVAAQGGRARVMAGSEAGVNHWIVGWAKRSVPNADAGRIRDRCRWARFRFAHPTWSCAATKKCGFAAQMRAGDLERMRD